MTDRPFSPKTLAERWQCSRRHIYDLISRGELRTFRVGGKLQRIAADEVSRWERSEGENTQLASTDCDGSTTKERAAMRRAQSGTRAKAQKESAIATGSVSTTKTKRDLRLIGSLAG